MLLGTCRARGPLLSTLSGGGSYLPRPIVTVRAELNTHTIRDVHTMLARNASRREETCSHAFIRAALARTHHLKVDGHAQRCQPHPWRARLSRCCPAEPVTIPDGHQLQTNASCVPPPAPASFIDSLQASFIRSLALKRWCSLLPQRVTVIWLSQVTRTSTPRTGIICFTLQF